MSSKPLFLGLLALLLLSVSARADVTLPVIDTESARRAGVSDGERDGAREGESRAVREAEEKGYREGRDRALHDTTELLKRRAYDDGVRDGRYAGGAEGQRRGSDLGRQQGLEEGRRLGETEGTERAQRDAESHAAAPATQAGNAAAEASDASAVGRKEGVVEGDGEAMSKAREVDYPRGREAYFQQRTGEAVKGTIPLKSSLDEDGFVPAQFSPGRQYPTPEENAAYRQGYDSGYDRGRRSAYDRAWRGAYDRAYDRGRDEGRREAERRDYSYEKRRGYDVGYREQYDASFENARVQALAAARAEETARTSQAVYSQKYQGFYDASFARIRDEAYRARYEALRTAAREAARASTFAALYPEYAKKLFQQGRVDEKADLAARPLRIAGLSFAGADAGGGAAPGQPLQLQLSLRNYGEAKMGAVSVQVEPVTAGSAYLPVPKLALGKEIPAKSLASGKDLLELQLRRDYEGQPLEFQVKVFYKDRLMDTRTVTLTPRS